MYLNCLELIIFCKKKTDWGGGQTNFDLLLISSAFRFSLSSSSLVQNLSCHSLYASGASFWNSVAKLCSCPIWTAANSALLFVWHKTLIPHSIDYCCLKMVLSFFFTFFFFFVSLLEVVSMQMDATAAPLCWNGTAWSLW